LRWLAGRREAREAWDAFEAVPGVPLGQACARSRSWADVRWWLLDLARECGAQTPEDRPPLHANRVWILDDGGAKLVDDPAVDRNGGSPSPGSCAVLLLDVVRSARGSSAPSWPLRAQRFVDRLQAHPVPSHAAIVRDLESLTRQRAVLTRGWRAAHILGLLAVPLLVVGLNAVLRANSAAAYQRLPREVREVAALLGEVKLADQELSDLSSADLEAIEIALASRYRHVLTDPRLFTTDHEFLGRQMRTQIERVLRRQPTEAEAQQVSEHALVQTIVRDPTYATSGVRASRLYGAAALVMLARSLTIVVLFAIVTAVLFRGGLMRAMGLELVAANGQPASRLRVLTRALIAWSPIVVLTAITPQVHRIESATLFATVSGLLMLLAGAIAAILRPERGIQDQLAGTWIVPH
jgi:hypothetical protein